MTDVSTNVDHRGGAGRPEPVVPAGLAHLLAQLAGPHDFWDRPKGYFGPLTDTYALTLEERAHANSLYRLGTKALVRGELLRAERWLGAASEAGHPGALFRLAALAGRADGDRREDVRFLVAEAARHGHNDARRLLAATSHRRPSPTEPVPPVEDPEFFEEVRRHLGVRAELLTPDPAEAAAAAMEAGQIPAPGGPHLVLVPPPAIPAPDRPAAGLPPGLVSRPQRPRLRALDGMQAAPLVQPLPDPAPHLAAAAAAAAGATEAVTTTPADTAASAPGGGRKGPWSANALRPAVLADMARSILPTQPPSQQAAVLKAQKLLHHIQKSGGISTRDLARRTGMSVTSTAWLLHWLRAQYLVETIAGAHLPGPVMEMASRPEQHELLMQQTLDGLRDRLGAAIYLSTYTGGEVEILQSSHGQGAPPVRVGAAFTDSAHASAVGKALLADLDFEARMEHLTRYQPVSYTGRTITDLRTLFDKLDRHGPGALQFDLQEYSDFNVCTAFSLTLPGHDATCVALALPADQHHRLKRTAAALSNLSTGLLLARLLTTTASGTANTSTGDTWPTGRAHRSALRHRPPLTRPDGSALSERRGALGQGRTPNRTSRQPRTGPTTLRAPAPGRQPPPNIRQAWEDAHKT
ncbi:IclR family transcriptional regulator C-terminal domain-containing protein [Streptomyces sp. NPDC046866]|uniref:IclR family transcriptional regulator domain-containing protein n=1 Tax=Streptomyces sp. NPDC046866 TaxID=3154921 RepID=UPI0034515C0B